MSTVIERSGLSPLQAWALAVGSVVALLAVGSVAFPRQVYAGFLWQYFWGPVYADAHGASCTAWAGGDRLLLSASECTALLNDPGRLAQLGPVAEPGYTIVSEIGYAITLVVLLVGVAFLLNWLEIGRFRTLFFALFPYMLLGGALRVVEDANNMAVAVGATQELSYPWNTLLISPVIYFTVFFLTLAALIVGVYAERRGLVEGFEYPLAGIGTAALLATVGYLVALAATTEYTEFFPAILLLTLGVATAVTWITWRLIERYAPGINRGTETIGLVMIWGHAVDGTANVIGLDWAVYLGWEQNLVPKHPVNQAVVTITESVLPASVVAATGSAWPFLLIKLVAAVVIVWIFDESVFEDSPRYTIMLLIAALAVGLGPGTRDMLRATFGV